MKSYEKYDIFVPALYSDHFQQNVYQVSIFLQNRLKIIENYCMVAWVDTLLQFRQIVRQFGARFYNTIHRQQTDKFIVKILPAFIVEG